MNKNKESNQWPVKTVEKWACSSPSDLSLLEYEAHIVITVMHRCGCSVKRAAKSLKISETGLRNKLRTYKYNLNLSINENFKAK